MREFGARTTVEARVYLTGGASAVLLGWRPTAIDVDIRFVPAADALFDALPRSINVDLQSPLDFIPALPRWEERSLFITRERLLEFYHYDFYAQCLAKIERGHVKDLADIRSMLATGLVERERLRALFDAIEPELYRYPAIDPPAFRRAVETTIAPA